MEEPPPEPLRGAEPAVVPFDEVGEVLPMPSTIRIVPSNEAIFEVDGENVRTVWGEVRGDKGPRGVYYLRWRVRSPEPVEFVITLGRFGEPSSAADRVLVAMHARKHDGRLAFMLVDASDSSFGSNGFLGIPQLAKDVRGSELAKDCFAIVDAVLSTDQRVIELRGRLED